MKISIITATYNSEKTLSRCLKSVAAQTALAEIEHIIVDGRSSDNTLKIISEFSHINKVISEKDRGIYHAFNKGIDLSTGEFVFFLNSDDCFYDEKVVSDVISTLNDKTDYYCGTIFCNNPDTGESYLVPPKSKDNSNFKPRHQAFFCRKSLFNYLGYFNECLTIAADTYCMKKIIKNCNGVFTDRIISRFQLTGISSNKENLNRIYEQDSIVDSLLGLKTSHSALPEKLAENNSSTKKIKELFYRSVSGEISLHHLARKSVAIFGTKKLSIIISKILINDGINPVGFVVSAETGYQEKNGSRVYGLQEAKGMFEVIINCIEGSHESEVTDHIQQQLPNVQVISWRDL